MKEFKISVKDIREIHLRRYHLVRSALELFLVDQTNYFFNFLSKKVAFIIDNAIITYHCYVVQISTKVYNCITSLHTPNLIYSGIIQPHKLLQASGLTHVRVSIVTTATALRGYTVEVGQTPNQ